MVLIVQQIVPGEQLGCVGVGGPPLLGDLEWKVGAEDFAESPHNIDDLRQVG
ncbi:MAG: hypothetical protein ACRDTA_15485 [Pseudonocardiaceae bacterium]